MIGEIGVGKISIISKGVNNIFNENYKSTLCFDHSWKNYWINNYQIRIQICNKCEQEIYHSVIKNLYKNALCIFLVFSNNLESFNALPFCLNEIYHSSNENIIIYLIGNKKDKKNDRKVKKEDINFF